jgi:hypothetical protein
MLDQLQLDIPSVEELLTELNSLAKRQDSVKRYIDAQETGIFTHPDGRTDDLGVVRILPEAAALLSYLCRKNPSTLSIEIGFGMGSSACVCLGTLADTRKDFEHIVFDPYGIPGRGHVVQAYIEKKFGRHFRRVTQLSQVGLGQLIAERGRDIAGLIFIDGSHRFDDVMTDFYLADLLCRVNGYVVLDDSWFPAIETVVNYIKTNRPDYLVSHLPARNISVCKKIAHDQRDWGAFTPFEVPNRRDWTAGPS